MTPVPPASWEAWDWNVSVLHAIQSTLPVTPAARSITRTLCEAPLVLCVALAAWSIVARRRYALGLTVVLASALVVIVESVVARVAPQPRPFTLGLATVPIEHVANNALPSTHVALGCVVWAAFVAAGRNCVASICFAATLAMMWARVATGLHWPIDMLGAVLTAAPAVIVGHVLSRRLTPNLIRSTD